MPNDNQEVSAVSLKKKTATKYSKAKKGTLVFPDYGGNILHGYKSQYLSASAPLVENGVSVGGCVGIELEMSFDDRDERASFAGTHTNIFQCTSDSSLSGEAPMEMQTCPLLPKDAKNPRFWEQITSKLQEHNASAWDNSTCGMHVHLDRRLFVSEATKKQLMARDGHVEVPLNTSWSITAAKAMYGLYVEEASWKRKLLGRTTSRYAENKAGGEIVRVLSSVLPQALKVRDCVSAMINEVGERMRDKYSEFNTCHPNTVEFRIPKASINPRRIAAVCEFFLLFAQYCRTFNSSFSRTSSKHFMEFVKRNMRKDSCIKDYLSGDEA